jgi:hypothetical protein
MNWQQRLGELVLAGGVLATAGCTDSNQQASSQDASPDATSDDAAETIDSDAVNFCCNAVADPCCSFLHCGAPLSLDCACQMDGGIWDYSIAACLPPDAGRDAQPGDDAGTDSGSGSDAGPSDAAADGDAHN